MLVAGLTGGIGSGKSALAELLAGRGAEIIDADEIGRAALDPGKPCWRSVIDHFGDAMLAPGGMEIDRKRLADVVFSDPRKLAVLNAIVHPSIMAGIADTLDVLRGTDEIVVIDAALIVEFGLFESLDALIVVVADEDTRAARLRSARAMTAEQISARIAAQQPESEVLKHADIVVHNNGSREELESEADRVWEELIKRRDAKNS